ncbi:MAG TPA: F0F1 ATP synthase subunit epsilon [Candidatus Omnitrophota bacterium]|nr:F0F1 ATP synthase subunit epsilon [Candidatus Omnitrophota bacterium]HPS20853.1 F0F1 ATP synthase subunit epsilon [Candidatus Omnitrophota bacterium]
MAASAFKLDILTPTGRFFSGDVVSLIVPAINGSLGVLADHAPLVACLKKGDISVTDPSGKVTTYTSTGSGFMEVVRNKAVLVADSIIKNVKA